MSSEVQENLQELVDYAIKVNKTAIHAIKSLEYKTVLNNARIALECICKGIFFTKGDPLSGNLSSQINYLYSSNYILRDKKDKFHCLRALGNNGSHASNAPVTIEEVKEARQLLNKILNFFYVEILETSIPKKLHAAMQAAPLKDLQATYKSLYTENVLNDLPLAAIYVLPRATFWKDSIKTNNTSENFKAIPSCPDLHQFVKHFIDNELETHYKEIKYPDSQALILLGAPGQGKTSFCKRVLYDFIDDIEHSNSNIFYIKLRDINNSDFLKNPFSYLIEDKFFPETTDKNLEEALIILDGLDELYLHNGGHLSEVDAFIETLLDQLKSTSYAKARLIITSRFGYLTLDKLKYEDNVSIACIDTFDENQQIEWVEKYQKAYPKKELQLSVDKIRVIHTKPLYQKQPLIHFQELFEQPVLLHLFVLSGLEVDIKTQRTQIYSQLFDKLSRRTWEKKSLRALKKVNSFQLKEIAKAIAFQMYKNKQTFLKKEALDEIQEVQEFYTTINISGVEQKKELYRYLFIAFYWQKKNKAEDQVLEFLHKSLQEYLIAEKIWDEFKKIADDSCTSSSHALEKIWSFTALQMIPKEIQEVLVEIIENDPGDYNFLVEKMKAYFPDLLKKQFMQECLPVEPIRGGVHAFYLYFFVLNTVHFKVYSKTEINEPVYLNLDQSDWFFSDLFNIAQLYYSRENWNLSCCSVNHYMQLTYGLSYSKIEAAKLRKISFNDIKFRETSFNQSILEEVRMTKTYLELCTFQQTQFNRLDVTEIGFYRNNCTHTNIRRSNFRSGSNISLSLFTSAEVIDSHFNDVTISLTSFEGAIFYENGINSWQQHYERTSSFSACNFQGCSFEKANLTRVSFRESKINGNFFEGANITQTDFSKVVFKRGAIPNDFSLVLQQELYSNDFAVHNTFKDVCFDNAFGKGTSFQDATLKGVSFKNAKLEEISFYSATIELHPYSSFKPSPDLAFSANFEQATLIRADFQNAKLSAVNFNHANLSHANFSGVCIENYIHKYFDSETNEDKEKTTYTSFKQTNLEGADFRGAVLKNINFQEANLTKSNLASLDLSGCSFYNANLKEVNLSCSTLNGVNFEGADLTDVKWIDEFYQFWQLLKAVEDGHAKIVPTENEAVVQITPMNPSITPAILIFKQIFEQLQTVKSFYNTKGLLPIFKTALIEEGYQHLFEAPKTTKPPLPKPPNTPTSPHPKPPQFPSVDE
jgi:uncharacterized protein YjbI with pentapeptide repeats